MSGATGRDTGAPERKHCTVAYATRERQYLWELELPAGASVGEALTAARRRALAASPEESAAAAAIPWDSAPLGIFGERVTREQVPRDGDRIEIYQPLLADPKEERRARVRRLRALRRGGR